MIAGTLPYLPDPCQAKTEIAHFLANIRRVDAKGRAQRLRAAMGYAGLENADVMKLLNISESTLARLKRGAKPLDSDVAAKVAERCGLPAEFFDMDFAALVDAPNVGTAKRLENVESQLASIWKSLSRLDGRTQQLEKDARERDEETIERELREAAEQAEPQRGETERVDRAEGA